MYSKETLLASRSRMYRLRPTFAVLSPGEEYWIDSFIDLIDSHIAALDTIDELHAGELI